MTTLLEATWRFYPATALALLGAALAVRALRREWTAVRGPVTDPATGGAMVRALRGVLAGLALLGLGAGWAAALPWLVIVSCVIGAEEMLEISVVLGALDDADRDRHSSWNFGGRFSRKADTPSRKSAVRTVSA
jgi:hypothetical protein